MHLNKLETRRTNPRESVCVVLAVAEEDEHLGACLDSVKRNTRASIQIVRVASSVPALTDALERLAPADVIVIDEPCRVTDGWIERLRAAARTDTNTASASAVADAGTALSLLAEPATREDFATLTRTFGERTLGLRPRLSRAVGPCVYLRREALELVGELDQALDVRAALELDFAQRCVLAGLAHVAADDVLVQPLAPPREHAASRQLPERLRERYPHLSLAASAMAPESSVLTRALEALRGPDARLWVTLDARALDGAVTGTQVHILELIVALARSGQLRLRLLVLARRIDPETLALLESLPDTEILAAERVDALTPRSTVFHRPQQTFSAGDVALATTLGERVVVSQLDLIAYRNPSYFADPGAWVDYRRASRHGLSAAERVVVFSEHTRRELLADALVEDGRIRVVPPGLDHRASGEPRRPGALEGVSLEDGFLLCLGTDFQHKNRVFALRLLAALRELRGWQGSLVLAGSHIAHGSSRELERAFLAEHPGLGGAVLELGSIDEPEKAWLLAHTGAVVYPSAYEGFGLVPFESALSGVPCVFAPQASLAEVAPEGTATILPWDPAHSAAAVHSLLSDGTARARNVQALADAARKLTWAAAASAILACYREAASAPVRDAATLSRDAAERELQLTQAHAATVQTLIDERELVLRDYNDLIEELGPGRGLIGPHGSLPEEAQHALLALSSRPTLSRAVYDAVSRGFVIGRAFRRATRRSRGTG
jgi:glycosyltransferase involved in cell wall biosynthesis